jgi:hypothetical protein
MFRLTPGKRTNRKLTQYKKFVATRPNACEGLFSGDSLEYVGGMAFGFDEGPDLFDFAGLADQEGTADDAHVGPAHELFLLPGAEFFDRLVTEIAEQGKVELLLLLERGLGLDGIGAHSQDNHAAFVELLLCVTKLGRFDGSTGGVGFGIEEEEDALALEIIQGHFLAVVGLETEVGSFGTDS